MDYKDIPNSPLPTGPEEQVHPLPPADYYDQEELDFLDLNPDLESCTIDCKVDPEQNKQQVIAELTGSTDQIPSEFTETPKKETIPLSNKSKILSATQQNKFHKYVEDQLMTIQRRFIQSHGLNTENSYATLDELLKDLTKVINFIWASFSTSQNFGQGNYLITIANDLLDYVEKYPLTPINSRELLKVLESLDVKFSKIIDAEEFNGTEKVRVNGIADRSRLELFNLFEKNGIDGWKDELSAVYENLLDRTG